MTYFPSFTRSKIPILNKRNSQYIKNIISQYFSIIQKTNFESSFYLFKNSFHFLKDLLQKFHLFFCCCCCSSSYYDFYIIAKSISEYIKKSLKGRYPNFYNFYLFNFKFLWCFFLFSLFIGLSFSWAKCILVFLQFL